MKARQAQTVDRQAPLTQLEYRQTLAAQQQTLAAGEPAALRTALINLIQSLIVQRDGSQLYGQIILFMALGGTSQDTLTYTPKYFTLPLSRFARKP